MISASLGIDVSKKKLDVTLLFDEDKIRKKTFANDTDGFEKLLSWIKGYHPGEFHACTEFTGIYDEEAAEFLYAKGHTVSRMNAMVIKSFVKSKLTRTKTDQKDSLVIAQYCKLYNPKPWTPAPDHLKILKDLTRTLEALKADHLLILNRLEKYSKRSSPAKKIWQDCSSQALKKIEEVDKQLNAHIKDHPELISKVKLLQTIPGISEITARILLAEITNIDHFKNARQLAAFAGLTPCQRQSGSSVHGKSRLSKIGSARLRKALYMPAVVALRYNPVIACFSHTLVERGKCKMVALGAAMRKLLHIVFGVLKHQSPFQDMRQHMR